MSRARIAALVAVPTVLAAWIPASSTANRVDRLGFLLGGALIGFGLARLTGPAAAPSTSLPAGMPLVAPPPTPERPSTADLLAGLHARRAVPGAAPPPSPATPAAEPEPSGPIGITGPVVAAAPEPSGPIGITVDEAPAEPAVEREPDPEPALAVEPTAAAVAAAEPAVDPAPVAEAVAAEPASTPAPPARASRSKPSAGKAAGASKGAGTRAAGARSAAPRPARARSAAPKEAPASPDDAVAVAPTPAPRPAPVETPAEPTVPPVEVPVLDPATTVEQLLAARLAARTPSLDNLFTIASSGGDGGGRRETTPDPTRPGAERARPGGTAPAAATSSFGGRSTEALDDGAPASSIVERLARRAVAAGTAGQWSLGRDGTERRPEPPAWALSPTADATRRATEDAVREALGLAPSAGGDGGASGAEREPPGATPG